MVGTCSCSPSRNLSVRSSRVAQALASIKQGLRVKNGRDKTHVCRTHTDKAGLDQKRCVKGVQLRRRVLLRVCNWRKFQKSMQKLNNGRVFKNSKARSLQGNRLCGNDSRRFAGSHVLAAPMTVIRGCAWH